MRAEWIAAVRMAVLMLMVVVTIAARCLAQAPQAGSEEQSIIAFSRSEFGRECGIRDTSNATAVAFSRRPGDEWTPVSASSGGGTVEMARIWHETNWMVDMHGALGAGMSSMHSGQMCFDAQGRITRILDRYTDMLRCGCLRLTGLTFAEDGRITRREQIFVNSRTGAHIEPPPAAQDFPEVFDFRRLEQLPFYSLMDKQEANP